MSRLELSNFRSERQKRQQEILEIYSAEQQAEILFKHRVLASIAYFIGNDYTMPVELNIPGKGWHWNFQLNEIRIDPEDLLNESLNKLRFKMAHEGGHRRITRAEMIPLEIWSQKGFSFMCNAIEDPRTNNFVIATYPNFRSSMNENYLSDLDIDGTVNIAQEKLGFQPKFIIAGLEYIKQWFIQTQSKQLSYTTLPKEVVEVLDKTVKNAENCWTQFPTKNDDNHSEELIAEYANQVYEIEKDLIWPEFKKLVELDLADQKVQEFMKDHMGQNQTLPNNLQDSLTDEEKKQLHQALKSQNSQTDPVINLDALPEELRQKLRDFIDSLPQSTKQKLASRAEKELGEVEAFVNEKLQGKFADNPDKQAERDQTNQVGVRESLSTNTQLLTDYEGSVGFQEFKKNFERLLNKQKNVYESIRDEVLDPIDTLERNLREILIKKRASNWEGYYKSGKKINLTKRMQEKALNTPILDSMVWQKRTLPLEKDYAISLLVDLSSSMNGEKIFHTFRGLVVIAEVLNRLSISTEIGGFNSRFYTYKSFQEIMSHQVRERIATLPHEVNSSNSGNTDLGWAISVASLSLSRQRESEKFLLTLTDGSPYPSSIHRKPEYQLDTVITRISQETDQKLIGLGLGPGTDYVRKYFPFNLANIRVPQMVEQLSVVIQNIIVS